MLGILRIIIIVLRSIGIPCRPVTNYSSAHDTDTSVTVDYHVDLDGRPIKQFNRDSVWNFHVWNDCWMQRPDLPDQYSGWQAVDGTPQEKSDGIYRVGPSPIVAVKHGEVGLGYDTSFVFAEVNADKCYWLHHGRSMALLSKEPDQIGRQLITKSPGRKLMPFNADLMDVTKEYKFSERSEEERMAVMHALFTGGSHAAMAYKTSTDQHNDEDVEFQLDLHSSVIVGEDFTVNLIVTNKSEENRTVEVKFRVDAVLYTGVNPRKVKADKTVIMVEPSVDATASLRVYVRDYLYRLMDQSSFVITVMARVAETKQIFVSSDDFRLKMPDVLLQVAGEPRVGRPFTLHAELSNPIPLQLTNCKFIVDGPGLLGPQEYSCKSVPPHGLARLSVEMKPWKAGERAVVVHFSSVQLHDIDGYMLVNVKSH